MARSFPDPLEPRGVKTIARVSLRGFMVLEEQKRKQVRRKAPSYIPADEELLELWAEEILREDEMGRPDYLLFLDTETATAETARMPGFDPSRWNEIRQPLLFGSAHLYEREVCYDGWFAIPQPRFRRSWEIIFYPDDLPHYGQSVIAEAFRMIVEEKEAKDLIPKRWAFMMGYHPRCGILRETDDFSGDPTFVMLVSLSGFLRLLRHLIRQPLMIVGFNLPFDLSRLAFRYRIRSFRRPDGTRERGYAFYFWKDQKGRPLPWAPALYIIPGENRRAMIFFRPYSEKRKNGVRRIFPYVFFLDIYQLHRALSGTGSSLENACRAWGLDLRKAKVESHGILTPSYVLYNRQDVLMTARLTFRLLEEFDRHPFSWANGGQAKESEMFSSASVFKAYLREMGVQPRRKLQRDFPPDLLGACMGAYYGGRTEARIVRHPVPVTVLDFKSMYPTVSVLMGVWDLIIAARVHPRDVTEEIRGWLQALRDNPDLLFDPKEWKRMITVCWILPDGDLLPVRARYDPEDPAEDIGQSYLYADRPLPYMLPDVAASVIRTGKIPRLIRAIRFLPEGQQESLKPVALLGRYEFHPDRTDFFRFLVEERARVKRGIHPYDSLSREERKSADLFLKIMANSGYGVCAELHEKDLQKPAKARIYWGGKSPLEATVDGVEEPGIFFFPPIAAAITAAARLMLALVEREVYERDGWVAYMDTDSAFIVSSPDGGLIEIQNREELPPLPEIRISRERPAPAEERCLIRALSEEEIEAIRKKFRSLNPYDPGLIQDLLELKEENQQNGQRVHPLLLALGPKRYALYLSEERNIQLIDYRLSALGGFLDPTRERPPVGKEAEEEDPDIERQEEWEGELWKAIIRAVLQSRGFQISLSLPWKDRPAVRQISIRSPGVLDRFRAFNRNRPETEQVWPFNFAMTLSGIRLRSEKGRPVNELIALIAPLESNASRWSEIRWIRAKTGEEWDGEWVTWESFARGYLWARQPKLRNFWGSPADNRTKGLLFPGEVIAADYRIIGKETLDIEDSISDLAIGSRFEPEIAGGWGVIRSLEADLIREASDILGVDFLSARLGVSRMAIYRWLSGERSMSLQDYLRLTGLLRDLLESIGKPNRHPSEFPELWKQFREETQRLLIATAEKIGQRPLARKLGIALFSLQRYLKQGLPKHPDIVLQIRRFLEEIPEIRDGRPAREIRKEAFFDPRKELIREIQRRGGIRPPRDPALRNLYRRIPKSVRAKGNRGLPPDEMADEIARDRPDLGIMGDVDLLEKLAG